MNMIIATSSLESFIQLITVLIIFIFVLVLTYFTTRWMAGIQKGRSFNKNLRIVETINVGNNKMISIVEIGKKYIAVSIGKDEVNFLTELSRDDLKDLSFLNPDNQNTPNDPFADVFNRLKKNINNRSKND